MSENRRKKNRIRYPDLRTSSLSPPDMIMVKMKVEIICKGAKNKKNRKTE